ncbi:dehydrogenase/reductase SDR family member 4-like [Lutzomyia longipalpis]|uniref:dehydrogenase/reductase SDR family member 4-like n=1 Tax=Lutzomyia longipalpis TaxID=7200 RepID=UPI0024844FEC|nr:dehydrogenase/reductase SDR family member 4-like [Lutzomyia longipalpis]
MAHKGERFVGKVAVLTASSDGIGLAIARRLGLEKAKVVLGSRNITKVRNAVELLRKEGIDAIGVQCHVANAEERKNLLEEAVKHYGGIDILVSCAGTNPNLGFLTEMSEAAFSKIFDTNVEQTPEYEHELKYDMPMKRKGRPEEVAGPAAFLLSDDASFITGETLLVTGGMQSRI